MSHTPKKKKRKKISPKYLENAGLAYLQRFSASSSHFKTIMLRKVKRSFADHPDQDMTQCLAWLDALIEKFQHYGYLNDALYAKSLAKNLRYKGFSQYAALHHMAQKGIPHDTAKTYLDTLDQEFLSQATNIQDPDYISALRLCKRRRIGPFRRQDTDKDTFAQKELASLARNGYSYDTAKTALDTSPQDALEILQSVY